MIDISYVITVYNKEKYMEPMLYSLENQTGDFTREYIFVDDGSSDGSTELIKKHTANWPNVQIIEQENQGPSGATNTGGFKAEGEFIKIVDADDLMFAYTSSRMMEMMREQNLDRLEAGWTYSDDLQAEFLQKTDPSGSVDVIETPLKHFILKGMAGSTSTMIRTSAFQEVGGCDPEVFVQDFSLPLRLSKKHRLGKTDMLACAGPREADGRMLSAHATVIYCLSQSMYHFLRDNPHVPSELQRLAFKRCAGRAWKWAKREQGQSMFSRAFYLYLLAQLPIWSKTADLIQKTLYVWDTEEIRHPPKKTA